MPIRETASSSVGPAVRTDFDRLMDDINHCFTNVSKTEDVRPAVVGFIAAVGFIDCPVPAGEGQCLKTFNGVGAIAAYRGMIQPAAGAADAGKRFVVHAYTYDSPVAHDALVIS